MAFLCDMIVWVAPEIFLLGAFDFVHKDAISP